MYNVFIYRYESAQNRVQWIGGWGQKETVHKHTHDKNNTTNDHTNEPPSPPRPSLNND